MTARLLFFAGSARADSINKKLAKAAHHIALEQGASATLLDLKDYPLPLYDGDLEAEHGLPQNAIELKKIFVEHDGLFIASPEYNSSFSALLKNTLDWISRPQKENDTPLSAFQGKVAAITAASPGGLGGLRGLVHLRMVLSNISVIVIPNQLAIAHASESFDEKGNLTEDRHRKTLSTLIASLITVTEKLL